MRAITINTYGGSLLIGAQLADVPVDASLEDSDFGTHIQRLNFPDLKIIKDVRYWPDMDLSEHVVIAHPPCSAFSVQNNSKDRKGTGSDAFSCTVRVLDYSMKHKAKVILVESVTGALDGAREVHDAWARDCGYYVFRILLNSVSFGVPQFRPRFWAAFVREDVVKGPWPIFFRPDVKRLKDIMLPEDSIEAVDHGIDSALNKNITAWEQHNVPRETARAILSGQKGFGLVNSLISGSSEYGRWAPGGFRSKHVRLLDPEGFAPTVLLDSAWVWPAEQPDDETSVRWRRPFVKEYLRIMGFPDDYKMPQSYWKSKYKMYLSKGVCPPVAAWVLNQSKWWFKSVTPTIDWSSAHAYMEPGQTLDLRVDKKEVA